MLETDRYRVEGRMTLPSDGFGSRLSDHVNRRDVGVLHAAGRRPSPPSTAARPWQAPRGADDRQPPHPADLPRSDPPSPASVRRSADDPPSMLALLLCEDRECRAAFEAEGNPRTRSARCAARTAAAPLAAIGYADATPSERAPDGTAEMRRAA